MRLRGEASSTAAMAIVAKSSTTNGPWPFSPPAAGAMVVSGGVAADDGLGLGDADALAVAVGDADGLAVGDADGLAVGDADGLAVGDADGVGDAEGSAWAST